MKKTKAFLLAVCIVITACFGWVAGFSFKSEALEAESLQVADVTLYQGMDSRVAVDKDGNEYEEYVLTFEGYGDVVLKFKDGSEYHNFMYGGNYIYDFCLFRTNCLELQREEHWQTGQTYEVTAEVVEESYALGMSSGSSYEQTQSVLVSTTFNVTIEENPVERFEIPDAIWYEGFELNTYELYREASLILKDGTSCDFSLGTEVKIKDRYCYIGLYLPGDQLFLQNSLESWIPGNTYELTAKIFRYGEYHQPTTNPILQTKFNIKFEPNPIESIEFADITLYEGLAGSKMTDWETGEEYTEYYGFPTAKVTFKDGTQGEFNDWIYYEQSSCRINSDADSMQQEEHWKPGNTYTVTATAAGFSDTFNVTIAENPIASIEAKDIILYEGLDSYINTNWETGESYIYYNNYNLQYEFTVNYKDGTKKSSSDTEGGYVEVIPGAYHWLGTNIYELQWKEHWTVGNTYTVTGYVAGVETTFNVTIAPNPVAGLEIADMTLHDKLDGYTHGGWDDEEEFFIYDANPNDFTVTFKDGTKQKADKYGNISFSGRYYMLDIDYGELDQHEKHWEVGKTYEITGEFAGVTDKFKVTIEESYTDFTIGGKNQLILTFTKNNGEKEIYRALDFEELQAGGDEDGIHSLTGYLYTDRKVFIADFEFNRNGQGLKLLIGEMESNILPDYPFFDKENAALTTPVDTDGDDTITCNDAVYLIYHIFKPDDYPVSSEQDCDFNGDGEFNTDDAIYLLYHIFLPEKYPI